jgi:hypothetical protein
VREWDEKPLTGRSEEAKRQLRSYRDWHRERDSDPDAQLNADRLKWLKDYWAVWENPKLLDEQDATFAYLGSSLDRVGS